MIGLFSFSDLSRLINGEKLRLNGAFPDPFDSRDRLFEESVALPSALPVSADLDQGQAPKNQDGTGSCCGQGAANAVWLAYQYLGIKAPELSALFPYYNSRLYHQGSKVKDTGTSVRYTLKGVKRFGLPPETAHPMVPSRVNTKPSWNAYRLSYDYHGVRGYYRIAKGDVASWRKALALGFPIVAWWKLDRPFKSRKGPDVIGPCDWRNDFAGNHCMCCPTYYPGGDFGILNSWGAWRRNGRQRVTEAFIAEANDAWAMDVQR